MLFNFYIGVKHMSGNKANRIIEVAKEAVNKFLREMARAGFVENSRRMPPKRIIDYVPPLWVDLTEKFEEVEGDE